MADTEYRRALDAACREWETVAAERAVLDKRLAELTRTIATLSRRCGLTPTVPFGLADGCRIILARGAVLTAGEMRAELEAIGFDFSAHANPLASIHVTLKRLVQAGQARFTAGGPGRPPTYAGVTTAGARAMASSPPAVWTPFSPVPSARDPAAKVKASRRSRKKR